MTDAGEGPDGAALGEFALIDRYFRSIGGRADVLLGVGDDGAVLRAPPDQSLVMVTDTVVAGVHFPEDAPADAVGHRVLAVNLSDLAAMGATPAWLLLALTLPEAAPRWLAGFADGLARLARRHGMALVGGDTTRGPLTATVHACGFARQPLRRDGARTGDAVWVSGDLGSGAGGLHAWQQSVTGSAAEALVRRFLYPEPRVALGTGLAGLATAAIDVSDGLLADAAHIADASGVRLDLTSGILPLAPGLVGLLGDAGARDAALRGGDDYELLFTTPAGREDDVRGVAAQAGVAVTRIGHVGDGHGVALDGATVAGGYEHFHGASS